MVQKTQISKKVLSNDSINGTDQSEVVVDKYSGEEFEIERNSDFITILPHIITPEGCEHIIEQFINLPFSECEYADSQVTPPKEIEEETYHTNMRQTITKTMRLSPMVQKNTMQY